MNCATQIMDPRFIQWSMDCTVRKVQWLWLRHTSPILRLFHEVLLNKVVKGCSANYDSRFFVTIHVKQQFTCRNSRDLKWPPMHSLRNPRIQQTERGPWFVCAKCGSVLCTAQSMDCTNSGFAPNIYTCTQERRVTFPSWVIAKPLELACQCLVGHWQTW